MLKLDNVTLVEYKPLRSNPSVRVLIDINEVKPEVVQKLHEMRMLGDQQLTLILTRTDDLKELSEQQNE